MPSGFATGSKPRGSEPVIPHRATHSTAPRPYVDRKLDRHRNVIERLVRRLKECRRTLQRNAINYLGMIKMSIIRYDLNLLCSADVSNTA
jgi:transposase